jgi:hypothetical protein
MSVNNSVDNQDDDISIDDSQNISSNNQESSIYRRNLIQAQLLDEEVYLDARLRAHDIDDMKELTSTSYNDVLSDPLTGNLDILNEMKSTLDELQQWRLKNFQASAENQQIEALNDVSDEEADGYAAYNYTELPENEALEKLAMLEIKVKALEDLVIQSQSINSARSNKVTEILRDDNKTAADIGLKLGVSQAVFG